MFDRYDGGHPRDAERGREMKREMMRGFDNGQTEKWTFAILELLKISSFLNAALLNSRAACNCLYSHFLFPPFSCS